MKKEDSLHQLIRSLDTHEKRLFKVYVANNHSGKNNNYITLFDIVSKMEVYDESKVKKKLGNTNTSKNLAQSKKYLKDIILKSMRSIDDERPEDRVTALLKEQYFLNKKNLIKEQWKKLQKAKEVSIAHDCFDRHSEILDIEMYSLNKSNLREAISKSALYRKTKEDLHHKIDLRSRLIVSKTFIFHLVAQFRNNIDAINLALAAAEIKKYDTKDIEATDSFTIKMWYYNICSNYYFMANENDKQLVYQQKLLRLFDEYPHFKKSNIKRFISSFFNYLGAISKLKKFDLLKEELDNISSISFTNINEEGEFYESYIVYKSLYAISTGNLRAIIDEADETIVTIDKLKTKMYNPTLLTIYYNYAMIFFLAEEFDTAIEWVDRIIDMKTEVKQELQTFACLITILCHYEMGNFLLIESLCRSINRAHELSPIEKTVCNSLRKLAVSNKEAKKPIWENMQSVISTTTDKMVSKELLTFWIGSHLTVNKSINALYLDFVKK